MDWAYMAWAGIGLAIGVGLYVGHAFTERRWARDRAAEQRGAATPAE